MQGLLSNSLGSKASIFGDPGMQINGNLYETNAGQALSAGDFVGLYPTCTSGSLTYISTVASSAHSIILPLATGKALAIYYQNTVLYAHILTISGTSITVGERTNLMSGSITEVKATVLSDSLVAVTYVNSGNPYLFAISISGSALSVGNATILYTPPSSMGNIEIVVLTETIVLVAGNVSAQNYLYTMVCSISGLTVTCLTIDTPITGFAMNYITLSKLTPTKVFIGITDGSNQRGVAYLLTVGQDNHVVGGSSGIAFTANERTDYIKSAVISGNRIIAVYRGASSVCLMATVFYFDGTSFTTWSIPITLSTETTVIPKGCVTISPNQIFVFNQWGASGWTYGIIISVYGINSIQKKVAICISPNNPVYGSVCSVGNNSVLVFYINDSNYYSCAAMVSGASKAKKLSAVTAGGEFIDGVAKSAAITDGKVQIYMP
ncbi:MAG: hypothetical protein FNP40_02530 [Dehalobacter sp. 4CP]|uniref:hypothetical protein n=1 Tax=Dehalobacter sp. CP TaxID=2594474 RepID=UPI0013C70A64|nr:hypothetical protein [Dehalobacter sp.]NBJ14450.1 hypothetical protein [Dehalobacter sp. 4CP]